MSNYPKIEWATDWPNDLPPLKKLLEDGDV